MLPKSVIMSLSILVAASLGAAEPEGDLIGSWLADRGVIVMTYTLYRDGSEYLMHEKYDNGEFRTVEMSASTLEGKLRLETKGGDKHGEFFLVNEQGDLEFWATEFGLRNFFTAPRI